MMKNNDDLKKIVLNMTEQERIMLLKVLYPFAKALSNKDFCSESEFTSISFDSTACYEAWRDILETIITLIKLEKNVKTIAESCKELLGVKN